MAFEVFDRKHRSVRVEPKITISKAGTITLNVAVVERWLKDVTHIQLLFDAQGNRIGVKPVDESADYIYPVRQVKGGSCIISGNYYAISHDETRRIPATWDERTEAIVCSLAELY